MSISSCFAESLKNFTIWRAVSVLPAPLSPEIIIDCGRFNTFRWASLAENSCHNYKSYTYTYDYLTKCCSKESETNSNNVYQFHQQKIVTITCSHWNKKNTNVMVLMCLLFNCLFLPLDDTHEWPNLNMFILIYKKICAFKSLRDKLLS